MRSDLNMLTNIFDVVSYDFKNLTNKVDVLNCEMAETKRITDHLQEDIDETRIIALTALAFGVAGSVSSIGMQLSSAGIAFMGEAGSEVIEGISDTEKALYHLGDGSNLPSVP